MHYTTIKLNRLKDNAFQKADPDARPMTAEALQHRPAR
jgi:hypothetical protein